MKRINWNRVIIAWAIGSLLALAGSHGSQAAKWNGDVMDKNDKPPAAAILQFLRMRR